MCTFILVGLNVFNAGPVTIERFDAPVQSPGGVTEPNVFLE
jgi:hypothetical protein